MSTRITRHAAGAAALVLILLVSRATAQDAPQHMPLSEKDLDALIQKERPALEQRKERLKVELAAIDAADKVEPPWAKEWAGSYYTGDGLGQNVVLTLAPNSGLTYTWNGCLGLYDANHGDIVETFPDGVRARLEIDPRASHWAFLSQRLYFVRWGDRRYLVPECKMVKLVNNYNEGSYARASMYDIPQKFEDRVERMAQAPAGRPELPPEYAKLIIEKPMRLKITKVTTQPSKDITGARTLSSRVVLAGGRDQNVYAGMEISYERAGCFGSIRIDKVDDKVSEGTIMMFGVRDEDLAEPEVGAELVFPGAAPDRKDEPRK